MKEIAVKGARTHNLKNLNVTIPRDELVVVTGLSGSGKSSLLFDTLYAEGQRRYVESLSTYARQFLSLMEKPDVDHIAGLSPAISIEQKSVSHNPRSTVGTTTEIYDYLRLLFARVGKPYCPTHNTLLQAQTISQMVDSIYTLPLGERYMILAPIVSNRKGEHVQLLENIRRKGFVRVRINGELHEIDLLPAIDGKVKNTIEVVIDRFKLQENMKDRLSESLELANTIADGVIIIEALDNTDSTLELSSKYACPKCGFCLPKLEPIMFSFNSPNGACKSCDGLGMLRSMDEELVIIDPELSLEEGVIYGWGKDNKYWWQLLSSVAHYCNIDISTPWKNIPQAAKNIILHGTRGKRITLTYDNIRGGKISRQRSFEGVLPNMQRRYLETESNSVKEELTQFLTFKACETCHGSRLNELARCVRVQDHLIHDVTAKTISESEAFFNNLTFSQQEQTISARILKEICDRLHFLNSVGLGYLSLDRASETLSGGESQRIRLASQIGSGLVGVMYILDEPSIGLHQRDNQRLLDTLKKLRDLGNSVLVVEHDEDAILQADHVIDIGPGAGVHGGEIIAQGTPEEIKKNTSSITGKYLCRQLKINKSHPTLQPSDDKWISISKASGNNLKEVSAKFPIGLLTCVTGVSGSGKSTLVNDTLLPHVNNKLNRKSKLKGAVCESVSGLDHIDKVIAIDQNPIGRTPRSNPATYTGLFTPIRELFAGTPEARARGYTPGRFSFNVRGGRCEACSGDGLIKVEMHFLADVYVTCDLCQGKRYNPQTLDIHYKGKTIADVLALTCDEALSFFENIPSIHTKIKTLVDVGLGYIQLGQSATTLSGGEAQRIKLARELAKRQTGKTLYILDEPTTGLHFHDIDQLLKVLMRLREGGNTIVVIEHNLDVIKVADWIIDLGPEGGTGGGEIVCYGNPETICQHASSHTGMFLKKHLLLDKTAESV